MDEKTKLIEETKARLEEELTEEQILKVKKFIEDMANVNLTQVNGLPEVVTIKQASSYLQVADITIRRAIADGKLKAFKVGRDWRIEKGAILEWTKGNKGTQET